MQASETDEHTPARGTGAAAHADSIDAGTRNCPHHRKALLLFTPACSPQQFGHHHQLLQTCHSVQLIGVIKRQQQ
jgi:hypothetical protein